MRNIFSIILILFVLSCDNSVDEKTFNKKLKNKITGIDISNNDSIIVFTAIVEDTSYIYLLPLSTYVPEIIFKSINFCYNPLFFNNGKELLFVSTDTLENYYINKININDSKIIQSDFISTHYIAKAIFSLDETKIYYISAAEQLNYSPIAKEAPHNMDVYSFDNKYKKTVRLTRINEYSIRDINLFNDGAGIIFNKNNLTFGYFDLNESNKIRNLTPSNFNELNIALIGGVYVKNNLIYFTSPYELFLMDTSFYASKLMGPNAFQLSNFTVDSKNKKMFFSKNIISDTLFVFIYDFDSKQIKNIVVE
ncbi:MAG: hypothetical protein HND27_05155 [Bacteroidetes bacterium]|nr:hypothetical protein [Bacteroidota bacterium]NOG95148.1 hypothetical protein [Bacteroidota bacterium]